MDLEVVSISRLGLKVLSETGGGRTAMINKYGRHMLLTKILRESRDELDVYRGLEKKQSFVEMVNNFISELKQYGTVPKTLEEIRSSLAEHTFLGKKLKDIQLIFQRYEECIQGKYLDTEDYVSLYTEKIGQSSMVRSSEIWIYGFDSFTPKNIEVIGQLIKAAPQVHCVFTCSYEGRDQELFSLTQNLMERFCKKAEEENIAFERKPIPDIYQITDKTQAVRHLEQELYSIPVKKTENHEGITLLKAANFPSFKK